MSSEQTTSSTNAEEKTPKQTSKSKGRKKMTVITISTDTPVRVKTKAKMLKRTARKPGPAAKLYEVKTNPERGTCWMKGCSKPSITKRSRWCGEHKRYVRKLQLAENNKVWRRRVEKGEAGHHVAYKNRPTEWAAKHLKQAEKAVKSGKSVYDEKAWQKVVAKVPAKLKALNGGKAATA